MSLLPKLVLTTLLLLLLPPGPSSMATKLSELFLAFLAVEEVLCFRRLEKRALEVDLVREDRLPSPLFLNLSPPPSPPSSSSPSKLVDSAIDVMSKAPKACSLSAFSSFSNTVSCRLKPLFGLATGRLACTKAMASSTLMLSVAIR